MVDDKANEGDNVGLPAEPAAVEEVTDDEDLVVPGSLESIEGSPASPELDDPNEAPTAGD